MTFNVFGGTLNPAQSNPVTNYFLLSLSVADFTIGAISMPLYTAYLVLGNFTENSLEKIPFPC